MDLVWQSKQNHSNSIDFEIFDERPNHEAIPEKYHFILITLYSLTALFSLLGNLVTLVVLYHSKKTSKTLAKYLINLSCSDLLMSTSIPFTYTIFMYGQWFFVSFFCPVAVAIQFYSVFVSVFTLVAIGINRYIAIKKPIESKAMADHFTNMGIAIIWILGFIFASYPFRNHSTIEVSYNTSTTNSTIYVCHNSLEDHPHQSTIFGLLVFLITFMGPVCIMLYVYSSMAMVVFHRNMKSNASEMFKEQKRKIIQILIVVVLTFVLCWLPLHMFNLVVTLYPQIRVKVTESSLLLNTYTCTFFAFHWLAMAHSCANPVIYSFMSQNFRKELFGLFGRNNKWLKLRSSFRSSRSMTTQYTVQEAKNSSTGVAFEVVSRPR